MELTSIVFFAMVAVSLPIYWLLPGKYQWWLLLVDSLIFYFANATGYTFAYVCLSVASVYCATRRFEKLRDAADAQPRMRRVLVCTLLLNVGILAVLKYTNLAIHTFNFFGRRILRVRGISDVTWLAPLAVSFYTLQLVSYLLDCYWGVAQPFSNPLRLCLYTIYFPLMTSGPICRFGELGGVTYLRNTDSITIG